MNDHSMRSVDRHFLVAVMMGLLAAVAIACGGDGDSANPSGAPRMTDPAAVPVADRVAEDQVYVIQDNGVIAPSGVSATLPEPNGGQPDGEDPDGDSGEPSPASSGETYTVQSGDTCSAIASTLGVSLDELLSANPQVDAECGNIRPNDELNVPDSPDVSGTETPEPTPDSSDPEPTPEPTSTPEPSGGSGQQYEVQSGDICLTIAEQFDVDVNELIELNNLDCNRMQVGDVIEIP